MPLYTILIKPVSGLCNMHCDYCFYCDEMEKRSISSYGMMSERTLKNLIRKAMHQARGEVCFAFQGGEPTLRGIIACLDPLGEERGKREYSLTPEMYGEFLIRLFRLWDKDWKRGRAPVIRQFENYIGILMGYEPEACEQRGKCSVQCVAEADGSAYPCDFYVLDEYRLGNYNSDAVEDMLGSQNAVRFVRESLKSDPECMACKWYPLCRGGCRRHRVWNQDSDAGRNYFCRGYQMFFEKCGTRMKEIAQYARNIKM